MKLFRWFILILFLSSLPACSKTPQLKLVTTTTVQDSGFADELKAKFELETGIDLLVIARGSGEALELGRRGDADLLLTHSPNEEKKFIAKGHGFRREFVMANRFVLVGPSSKRKIIEKATNISTAFYRISHDSIPFVSRSDRSGTHIQEIELWNKIPVKPDGDWYIESGSGMGATLRIANEKRACTLCDLSTFIAMKSSLDLEILFEPQPKLRNEYHLIIVNQPKMAHSEIASFHEFLYRESTQEWIRNFGIEKHGEALFETQ